MIKGTNISCEKNVHNIDKSLPELPLKYCFMFCG